MRKTIALLLLLALALPAVAQHEGDAPRRHHHPEITEMVKDLNNNQKRKIETISRESRERVDALRRQQKQVRDSIGTFMALDGDQSARLFPLFEREAQLKAAVSREMYTTKVRIDQILTPEQRARLRESTLGEKGKKPRR